MNLLRLLIRSSRYYGRSHLAVMAGVAICTMVITGALIIGDSVKASLEKMVIKRLGNTQYSFSGPERFFRSSLADSVEKASNIHAAPILLLNGFASSQGGAMKVGNVQVIGVDEQFFRLYDTDENIQLPGDGDVIISSNLATRLQLKEGDDLLLRMEKSGPIPKNAPFVSDQDNLISFSLKVIKIADNNESFGHFNLKNSQTPPLNLVISVSFLNKELELNNRANIILFSPTADHTVSDIERALNNQWNLEDIGLTVTPSIDSLHWEIRSDRVFIDSSIVSASKKLHPGTNPTLTYLANYITLRDNETPYSFVSAGPFANISGDSEILINEWLADDLGANAGDTITMSYYIIGPLRELVERQKTFIVKAIVAQEGVFGDPNLMPDLPGLSDAGSCSQWEAGIPVDLTKIRDKDEEYWKKYIGTPKAFISYATGLELWRNRYGVCTILSVPSEDISLAALTENLGRALTPDTQGYEITAVREEGFSAARGGVDFGQLFLALSFFLLVAAMTLTALLFNLHLDRRKAEIGTFKALGFPLTLIKKIVLTEGMIIAAAGVIPGGILAFLYNKLVFSALNGMWYDIVRTPALQEEITASTLLIGMGVSFLLAGITVWFNVSKYLRRHAALLQKNPSGVVSASRSRGFFIIAIITSLVAIGLFTYGVIHGEHINPGLFFGTAIALLSTFILTYAGWLFINSGTHTAAFSITSLATKGHRRNPGRSIRIVLLFALGTFIVIAIGLNKKDLGKDDRMLSGGTGGYIFFMETTVPVLHDLNTPEVKSLRSLETPMEFLQIKAIDGDDASCLNLNRVSAPGIIGVNSELMHDRFTFVTYTADLDLSNPWSSLKKQLPGDVIPAIMDQTVIQWGLGKSVGDTLIYRDEAGGEMRLKLIGGLANSVFQGKVLIDHSRLIEHFPSVSGSNVFLIDGNIQSQDLMKDELLRAFRNEGVDIIPTVDRLAMFNEVENTYLAIFMILGGLALILGTIGLGISLARTLLDRRKETAVLRALGYSRKSIFFIYIVEHMSLLTAGTLFGALAATIAVWPGLQSRLVSASLPTALIIIAIILLNGFIWMALITKNSLHKQLQAALREE